MKVKNVSLGVLVLLTILFASLTLIERGQVGTVTTSTTTTTSETTVSRTVTFYTSATSTCLPSSGCIRNVTDSFGIEADYTGPWGMTYQGYATGPFGLSPTLVESGTFYGNAPTMETVRLVVPMGAGVKLCAEAQKLDNSNSTLALKIAMLGTTAFPDYTSVNQTSTAYGTTQTCYSLVTGPILPE